MQAPFSTRPESFLFLSKYQTSHVGLSIYAYDIDFEFAKFLNLFFFDFQAEIRSEIKMNLAI